MDLFGDLAVTLNYNVSNNYYGMFRAQISMYLPPKHPSKTEEINMVAVSPKRSIPIFSSQRWFEKSGGKKKKTKHPWKSRC